MKKLIWILFLAVVPNSCSKPGMGGNLGKWSFTVDGQTFSYDVKSKNQCVWSAQGGSTQNIALHTSGSNTEHTINLYIDYNYHGVDTYDLPGNYGLGYYNTVDLLNYPSAGNIWQGGTYTWNNGNGKIHGGNIIITTETADELDGTFEYTGTMNGVDKHITGSFNLKK